jgi:hypothetical protein
MKNYEENLDDGISREREVSQKAVYASFQLNSMLMTLF